MDAFIGLGFEMSPYKRQMRSLEEKNVMYFRGVTNTMEAPFPRPTLVFVRMSYKIILNSLAAECAL